MRGLHCLHLEEGKTSSEEMSLHHRRERREDQCRKIQEEVEGPMGLPLQSEGGRDRRGIGL